MARADIHRVTQHTRYYDGTLEFSLQRATLWVAGGCAFDECGYQSGFVDLDQYHGFERLCQVGGEQHRYGHYQRCQRPRCSLHQTSIDHFLCCEP
jgi:hypothetical protein